MEKFIQMLNEILMQSTAEQKELIILAIKQAFDIRAD